MNAKATRVRLLVAVLLSIAMLALLIRLGFWQLERATYKEALAAQAQENAARGPSSSAHEIIESPGAGSWYFRRVRLVGHFDSEHQYLLDNRTSAGRAGYHVLSVFRYQNRHLLVNRGWVPVGFDRQVLPDVHVAGQQVSISGHLAPPPGSGLLLGDSGYGQKTWPKVVQQVELDTMSRELGFSLLPAVVLLDSQHPACLSCRWVAARGISAERHRGYALQWFSLAGALIVLLGIVCIFSNRRSAG